MHRCKKTSNTLSITDLLSDDCLNLVYLNLEDSTDRTSFSLVCRRWLRIRFQHLKSLSVTGYARSQFFGLQVLFQCLKPRFKESAIKLSWFPRLASLRLKGTRITDNGLKFLAKYCATLEKIDLTNSQGITDAGISFLIRNCSKLHSVVSTDCGSVEGTGFLGCTKTLTHVDAIGMRRLTIWGIEAITSGGGIQNLHLSGPAITNKAVTIISKSCPLLKVLQLKYCRQLQLEGWKAIAQDCRNLKALYVVECSKLCDVGSQALCDGCRKLSTIFVDSLSDSALNIFKRERPNVHVHRNMNHK